MNPARALTLVVLPMALLPAGCGPSLSAGAGGGLVATTGPSRSMVSIFDTEAGLLVVDLGWWGAEDELESAIRSMAGERGERGELAGVLLTHAHRDHIAGWPAVRHATFYLAGADAPYLFGEAEYEAWVPRLADRIALPDHPRRGEVRVRTFSSDTALVFGADTVHAFLVPGHTPGSTAYLVRGVLFVGDAVSRTVWSGFRHARTIYSEDVEQAAASLRSLFQRLEGHDVDTVCTAHARCAPYDAAFRRDALGDGSARD